MLRVAALVPAYPPRSRVGAWVATHRFLAHLVKLGHHVEAHTTVDLEQPATIVDGVCVNISRGPRVDVIVCHAGDTDVALELTERWSIPLVVMVHGHTDPSMLDGADLVVFNSHALAATVDHPGPSIVCHPPVFADQFATTPGGRVTLVNLSEAKGGELFWRLARCSPDRLFLAVRGSYGGQLLYDYANVDVIPNSDNVRDDVYARTRILLMPSEWETYGMVAVEAIATGIPVIAHPTPGLVESLGPAGIFVDRDDGQAWLDQIERLDDPAEWDAASARSLARSADLDPQLDLERFAGAVLHLHGVEPSCALSL